jgi:serine/threonine protein kinase
VYDTSDEETARRQRLALSPHFSNQRFVLKTLRTDLPEDEHVKGICDLAIEADFLSKLSHVHIITMRAMANSDPHESKFFVILDRLVMTLDRKFNAWRKQIGENSGIWLGPCCGYCCAKRPVLYHIWLERLSVARDIAHALSYLHSQSICYRDLKPDNCGFNAKGQLKLFDFGLAKRMDPHDRTIHGVYNMTGNTGSLR